MSPNNKKQHIGYRITGFYILLSNKCCRGLLCASCYARCRGHREQPDADSARGGGRGFRPLKYAPGCAKAVQHAASWEGRGTQAQGPSSPHCVGRVDIL